jgi:NAD(P)-dependent dehydrogenase (short-subunit alcohol dehydrogenase family)
MADGSVVVTGAASGIGSATAAVLAEGGREVVSLDVREPTSAVAVHHHCDLSDPDSIDATVARLHGPIAALVNVAGVPGTVGPELTMRVNFLGLRHLTEAVLPMLADGGAVANVSSIAGNTWRKRRDLHRELLATADFGAGLDWWNGHCDSVGTDHYTFSKEAVVVYTMATAGAALERRIRCNDVGPGPVDTPILADFRTVVGDEQMSWIISQTGRAAQPSDVAEVLAWLAVGPCHWVNGQHLVVDGGFTSGVTAGWVDRTGAPAARSRDHW